MFSVGKANVLTHPGSRQQGQSPAPQETLRGMTYWSTRGEMVSPFISFRYMWAVSEPQGSSGDVREAPRNRFWEVYESLLDPWVVY